MIPSADLVIENKVGGWKPETVLSEFVAIGEGIARAMIAAGLVRPDSHVLDVGCGLGRVARPFTRYLAPDGRYCGIDVVKSSVEWCRKNYAAFPHFSFFHADLFNTYYNATAVTRASEYRFPFADDAFDFVWSTSLFTYLMLDETDNYLGEMSRVMKPGARCWNTFFLLDAFAKLQVSQELSPLSFPYGIEGGRVQNRDIPASVVASEEEGIRDLYARHGLVIEDVRYGPWSGRSENVRSGYQDVVIARKF